MRDFGKKIFVVCTATSYVDFASSLQYIHAACQRGLNLEKSIQDQSVAKKFVVLLRDKNHHDPADTQFHYNRALAQYYSGHMKESRNPLKLALPQQEPDDTIRIRQCRDPFNNS